MVALGAVYSTALFSKASIFYWDLFSSTVYHLVPYRAAC